MQRRSQTQETFMDIYDFNQQVLILREQLYRYSLRMLGNAESAEDMVQEAFLRLWLIRSQLETYRSVPALAMKVTKNLCLDYLKQRKTATKTEIEPQISKESAENTFERHQMFEIVKKIVDTLPGLQQMIFRMKDIEGYEVEEIALITGSKAEAVRINLSRARTKIRENIEKNYNRYDAYE